MDAFCCILLVTEDRHGFSSIWSKSLDFTPPRRSTPASGLALLDWKTRKNNSWGCSLEQHGRRAQPSLLQSRFLLSISKLLSDKLLALRRKSPHPPPPPLPNTRGAFHSHKKSVKFGETQMGCVRLGNLDVDFKIQFRICNRTRNPKKDFNAEICVFTVRLRNPKKDLKNCP